MRLRYVALAAALLAFPSPARANAAALGSVSGNTCGLVGRRTTSLVEVQLFGGPLYVTDSTGSAAIVTLTCTVQVSQFFHGGSGPSASGTASGVVYVPPSPRVFYAAPNDSVYVCTEISLGGTTYYWDDANDPGSSGRWSTGPYATCGVVITADWSAVNDVAAAACQPIGCTVALDSGSYWDPGDRVG